MTTRDIALVTGAAKGIGNAIARRLIADGMTVILTDIDEAGITQTATDLGEQAAAFPLDVTSGEQWEQVVQRVTSDYGPISVLVNNSGIAGNQMPFSDLAFADWQRVLDVNLNGVFYGCKAVIPGMLAAGYGRIVNISSIAGKQGFPFATHYCASKHAVLGLTKALSLEVSPQGVMVNAVTPGIIETDILKDAPQETLDALIQTTPVGRLGRPEEVANLVSYLASRDLGFTTGAVFDISGGVSHS